MLNFLAVIIVYLAFFPLFALDGTRWALPYFCGIAAIVWLLVGH